MKFMLIYKDLKIDCTHKDKYVFSDNLDSLRDLKNMSIDTNPYTFFVVMYKVKKLKE